MKSLHEPEEEPEEHEEEPEEENEHEREEAQDDTPPPTPPPLPQKSIESERIKSTAIPTKSKPDKPGGRGGTPPETKKQLPPNVYQRNNPKRNYEYKSPGDICLQRLSSQ